MSEHSDVASVSEVAKEVARLGNDVKSQHETMQREWKQFQEKAKEAPDAVTQAEMKKLSEAVLSRIETAQKASEEAKGRMDKIEAAMNRPASATASEAEDFKSAREFFTAVNCRKGRADEVVSNPDTRAYAEYKAAFSRFLRKDDKVLTADEARALSVGSDPDGGYLVTPQMSSRIVTKLFDGSNVFRTLATVETIGTDALELLVDKDEAGAGWVSETGARAATTTPRWDKKTITAHEIYAFPQATRKLLEDASVDVEAWLAGKVAEKFARTESAAFINGDGVGKPRGLLTYAAGTTWGQVEQVNSGAAAAIEFPGITKIVYSLKQEYAARATWLMKRDTVHQIMSMEDTAGNFVFAPPMQQGQAPSLYGYSIGYAEDMPTVAANSLSVAFGDFASAYTIVDRVGTRIIRDELTNKPYVGFYAYKRVGGDVVNFDAFKILKTAA